MPENTTKDNESLNANNKNTESKKIYSRSKKKYIYILAEFIHHITIPGSLLAITISLLIGLATSFYWSYKVTGSSKYMMIIFGMLNPEVTVFLFAIVVIFSLVPLIMGMAASEYVSNESSKPPSMTRRLLTLIGMFLVSLIIPISILYNKFPANLKLLGIHHLHRLWMFPIVILCFIAYGFLTIFCIYDKPIKDKWTFLVVPFAFFIGGFYGILILFFYAVDSSISHETGFINIFSSSYIICLAVLVMLFIGIKNGTDYFSVLFSIVFFSIALIILHTPQNVIMRLNNGITPIYNGLDRGITRAIWRADNSTNGNFICANKSMYAINYNGETLFSCREKITINKKITTPKNKYYRGIIINNVTHKIIYDAIADKMYKILSYNINCIRRIDGQFLCEREVVVPVVTPDIHSGS